MQRRYLPGGEWPLVDIESENERSGLDWTEWAAAMYESYAADHEVTRPGTFWYALDGSSVLYADTAMRAAEDIEFELTMGEQW